MAGLFGRRHNIQDIPGLTSALATITKDDTSAPDTVSQRRDSESPSGLRPLLLPWGKYTYDRCP